MFDGVKNGQKRPESGATIRGVRRLLGFLFVLLFGLPVLAEDFRAEKQYQDCGRFFNLGDLESALNSCRIAVADEPNYALALRLLTRVLIAQNNTVEAKGILERARGADANNPENDLLEGEIAFAKGDNAAAERLVAPLAASGAPRLQARALRVSARAMANQGRQGESIGTYRRLLALDPTDIEARQALSKELLETDPKAAVTLLSKAPNRSEPKLLADLGRAQWIAGDLEGAIGNLERAVASPAAFSDDRAAYTRALGALANTYYGMGRITEGQRVLAQIGDPSTLFLNAINRILPWLLGAVVLLVLHLWGESQIEPLSTIEIEEGPRPWTVVSIYRWLFVAAFSGLIVALFAGRFLYGNFLAIITPVQSAVVRDVYFTVFALVLVGLAVYTTRKLGWNSRELLIGPIPRGLFVDGIALGLILVALTMLYYFVTSTLRVPLGTFYLEPTTSRPSLVLPLLLLPLTEVFFRAYAVYPLEKRYGTVLTYAMIALMYALSFGTPVLLIAASGALLLAFTNRLRSSAPAVVAQWGYYTVLLVVLLVVPITRTWF